MELVVSLVVVLIAQGVTLLVTRDTLKHQSEQAEQQRIEARRVEWRSYLTRLMEHLIEARREYEMFLGTAKTDEERHAGIIGRAIAVCLAANDAEMARYADSENKVDGLTPYFVSQGQDGAQKNWDSRNRDAMQKAVQRLASMIERA